MVCFGILKIYKSKMYQTALYLASEVWIKWKLTSMISESDIKKKKQTEREEKKRKKGRREMGRVTPSDIGIEFKSD